MIAEAFYMEAPVVKRKERKSRANPEILEVSLIVGNNQSLALFGNNLRIDPTGCSALDIPK